MDGSALEELKKGTMKMKIRYVPAAPEPGQAPVVPEESKEELVPPPIKVPASSGPKPMAKKPTEPKPVKSNAYDLEPDDIPASDPKPEPVPEDNQADDDDGDLGLIGSVANQPPGQVIHSKTDVHQVPNVDDEVDEDLQNQSAEEIQFNSGGANPVVDEDVINAQAPGDDDFQ